MSTVKNFLDFIIIAVLHPTYSQKLCYKLSSIVTFTLIQIFFIKIVPSLLNGIRVAAFAWYSVKIRIIFGVRSERRKVDKKSKSTWKPKHTNSWIFLPNFIKTDPYNFELYRFKVGAFFETQCTTEINHEVQQQTEVKWLEYHAPAAECRRDWSVSHEGVFKSFAWRNRGSLW